MNIKKESEVLDSISEDGFWKAVARESLKRAWSKEDEVWDRLARKDIDGSNKPARHSILWWKKKIIKRG